MLYAEKAPQTEGLPSMTDLGVVKRFDRYNREQVALLTEDRRVSSVEPRTALNYMALAGLTA